MKYNNLSKTELLSKIEKLEHDLIKSKSISSDSKLEEEEIRESEQRWKAIVEQTIIGCAISQNNKVYFINQAYADIVGYSIDEIMSWEPGAMFKVIHPDDRAHVKEQVQKKEKNIPSYITHYTYRTIQKNGEIKFVSIYSQHALYKGKGADLVFALDISERLTAEEALKKSEEKYKSLINSSPMGMYFYKLEKDNRLILVGNNPAADQLIGLSHEKLIGKTIEEAFPNLIQTEIPEIYRKVARGELGHQSFELPYKDNRFSGFYKVDVFSNQPNATAVHFMDITKTKKDEQELIKAKEKAEENEAKFKELFNNAADAIFIADIETGIIIDANETASQLLLMPHDQIIGMHQTQLHPSTNIDHSRNTFKRQYSDSQKQIQTLPIKNEVLCSNGSLIPVEILASTITINNRQYLMGIFRNISMRKHAEYELIKAKEKAEESKANITAILEGTKSSIWAFNRNYQIQYINHTFQQEFLQSFGVLLEPGMNLVEALPETLRPLWTPRYDKVLANEQYIIEDAVPTENGIIYIKVTFNPIVKNGQVIGGSCFGSNITPRKLAEIELIKAKEQAEESDRLKSAFLANMSHEIRTPMNGILGFTNLLKEPGLSGEEQQQFLGIIEKSGDRMLNTINDIIDISRIESGQVDVIISDINLNIQLDDLFEFFLPEAKKKNIKLSVTNKLPNQQAILKSDIEKLNSILTNFIKNAIKFTHSGSIEFGYSINKNVNKNELKFYVNDTGIGIPKDRQKAVFNRFVQADIEDKQVYEGSGLGLAISKAYVELLGGRIWVESEEGIGSQFYFTIPYNTNDTTIHEESTGDTNNQFSIKKELKILVIDDDEFVIAYLKIILEDFNKEMLIAKTGIDGVEMCRDNPDIDLILMDIKIPGIDGYEATRRIRKFNKDVFILAQTAYAQSGDREKSIQAGCNAYISKPIKKERLLEIISNRF